MHHVTRLGGKTWQSLTVTRSHGTMVAVVRDPVSGFVSLRSAVTDVHGDPAEQAVYRACAVR